MTFTAADNPDKNNFTVKYLPDDGHNDDAMQLGLENIEYTLNNDAIPITFERVSSSPTVFIRENNDDPYKNVELYTGQPRGALLYQFAPNVVSHQHV